MQYLGNVLKSHDFEDLQSDEDMIDNAKAYRRIIDSLQYMVLTGPDIQYAVNKLSQFMVSPKPLHWTALKRVLRYLVGTPRYGILLRRMLDFSVMVFCDTDWGGDTSDKKSRIGYLVYVGGASRKQNTVARSSTEVEYRAIATTT